MDVDSECGAVYLGWDAWQMPTYVEAFIGGDDAVVEHAERCFEQRWTRSQEQHVMLLREGIRQFTLPPGEGQLDDSAGGGGAAVGWEGTCETPREEAAQHDAASLANGRRLSFHRLILLGPG